MSDVVYAVYAVIDLEVIPNSEAMGDKDSKVLGFMPVFKTLEDLKKEFPDSEYLELEVLGE